MARYFASAGVRKLQNPATDNLEDFPFVVIIGPSGNFGQIIGPSGATSQKPANSYALHAYEQTHNHAALAFSKNEILISLRDNLGVLNSNYQYAWMPYGQTEGMKINPTTGNSIRIDSWEANAKGVMFDGQNWKIVTPFYHDPGKEFAGFLRLPGGDIFWVFPLYYGTMIYGIYKGDNPVWQVAGSTSGWKPLDGHYGNADNIDSNFKTGNPSQDPAIAGIKTGRTKPATVSDNICDMIYYKGTIYVAYQYKVLGIIPGGRGNFVFHDYTDDTLVDDSTSTSTYSSRAINAQHTNSSKSFVIHNDELYMLQNDGKIYSVKPGGLILQSDLSTLGTPWSSGIAGGSLPVVGATWGGSSTYRCYIASFNKQLHAFLNYSTTHKVAKGTDGSQTTGHGIFWATSHDAVNWTDNTPNLPSSGIIPTSGYLANWLADINPYRFSGRTGYDRSAYSIWQVEASGIGVPAQPSGLGQYDAIPYITNTSGTMIDAEGTPYGSLQIPLSFGLTNGYLRPTIIGYPASYRTDASGTFIPVGTGPSGYDYTGCHNWHISGHSDKDKKVLHLLFSEDYIGEADFGSSLYYELTQSSGWILRNFISRGNQFNGFIPVDLYDPEIIIASGDLYNPNPRIDEINKTVTLDYKLYDWPYWGNFNVTMEYSTNGQDWHFAAKKKGVSAGSQATDPSGVIGTSDSITWNYLNSLSKNIYYSNVQLRLRATEI